jgi:hypothetical protein
MAEASAVHDANVQTSVGTIWHTATGWMIFKSHVFSLHGRPYTHISHAYFNKNTGTGVLTLTLSAHAAQAKSINVSVTVLNSAVPLLPHASSPGGSSVQVVSREFGSRACQAASPILTSAAPYPSWRVATLGSSTAVRGAVSKYTVLLQPSARLLSGTRIMIAGLSGVSVMHSRVRLQFCASCKFDIRACAYISWCAS